MHCGPCLTIARFLPASQLVQRSLVEGTSKFRCGSTATSRFGKLICDPTFCLFCLPMFYRSLQGQFPRYGSLCVRSSQRSRVAKSVPCSRFLVGICINFLVASCTHLSFARFYRLFSFCFVFIEQVSSQSCQFRIFSVLLAISAISLRPFCLFIASLRSWNWLVTYKHAVINAVVSWVVYTCNLQLLNIKNGVSTWCRYSRNGPITQWFAVLEVLHYSLTRTYPSPEIISRNQTSSDIPTRTQTSSDIPTRIQTSLTILTRTQTSSDILTRTQTSLAILTCTYRSLAVLTRTSTSSGILTRTYASLPVIRHPQPSLPPYLHILIRTQTSSDFPTRTQTSLAILTRTQTSSGILTRTQTSLAIPTRTYTSLPVLRHPQPSLPVLRNPQPSLPVLTHPYPYLDILRHPYP